MSARLAAIFQTLGIVMLACFAGVLAKLSLSEVHPFTFVWLQLAIGGVTLTAYTFGWRKASWPRALGVRTWALLIWIGIANFTVVRVLFLLSLEKLPVTTHIYLVNFVSIITMLLSIFILKERPSWVQLLGALIAIGGLHIFFQEIPAPSELIGLIYVSIAILALASTNNITRLVLLRTQDQLSSLVLSTVTLLIGGIPVVLYGLLFDSPPVVVGLKHWAIIAFNGLVSIALGLTVWNYVLRLLRSYEASLLAGSSVIFTAIFAIPILGDVLSRHELAGIGFMLLGLCLAQIRGK